MVHTEYGNLSYHELFMALVAKYANERTVDDNYLEHVHRRWTSVGKWAAHPANLMGTKYHW